jgi:hypothetical protein
MDFMYSLVSEIITNNKTLLAGEWIGLHHAPPALKKYFSFMVRLSNTVKIKLEIFLRSVLFWDFTQRRIVFPYQRFGATYRSHLQGSSSPLLIEKKTLIVFVYTYNVFFDVNGEISVL